MPHTPDLFTGWFDNQTTRCREYWDNGVKGRHAHRSAICPHSVHPELRPAWGSHPDLPQNASQELRAMAEQPNNSPASLSDEDFRKAMGFPDSYLVSEPPHCAGFTRNLDGSLITSRTGSNDQAKCNG